MLWPGRKHGNLGIFFPTFFLPTFRFWPNTQNQKLGKKNFRSFRIFDLPLLEFLIKSPRLTFQFRQIELFQVSRVLLFSFLTLFELDIETHYPKFFYVLYFNLAWQKLQYANACKCISKVSNKEQCVLYLIKINLKKKPQRVAKQIL